MNRPLGPRVQVHLTPHDHERVEAICVELGVGWSTVVRQLVHEALKARESK